MPGGVAADDQRGRLGGRRLQRRDLQLPGAARARCWPRPPARARTATRRSSPTSTKTRGSTSPPGSTASSPSPSSIGRRQQLFLVRDPLGREAAGVRQPRRHRLAFGSEAKAVLASGLVAAELDETSLHLSMNVRYVPGDRTFFRGIQRLAARPRPRGRRRGASATSVTRPSTGPRRRRLSRDEWMEGIRHHYRRRSSASCSRTCPSACRCRGASTPAPIVGHAATGSRRADQDLQPRLRRAVGRDRRRPVRGPDLRHRSSRAGAAASRPWPICAEAIRHTEEPKVNSLQLYLLHRFISEHVSVVLSGLGGDELFAGYDFYGYLAPEPPPALGLGRRRGRNAASPVLDWSARRAAGARPPAARPADPQAGMARLRPGRRSALSAVAQRLGLQPVAAATGVHPRVPEPPATPRRGTPSTATSAADAPCEGQALRAEFATKMVSRPPPQRGHHVDGALGRVAGPAAGPGAGPLRGPDPRRHPFRPRPKGLLKDALPRRAARPGAAKSGSGASPSIPSSSTARTSARWPVNCSPPTGCARSGVFNPAFVQAVLKRQAAPAAALALLPALADDRGGDVARDLRRAPAGAGTAEPLARRSMTP